jgi:hypothetical protein
MWKSVSVAVLALLICAIALHACNYNCYEEWDFVKMSVGYGASYDAYTAWNCWHSVGQGVNGQAVPGALFTTVRTCTAQYGNCNTTYDTGDFETGVLHSCGNPENVARNVCFVAG